MEFFFKNDGELVPAGIEQIMNPAILLFNDKGEEIGRPAAELPSDDLMKISSVVDTLADKVNGILTTSSGDVDLEKENVDLKEKLASYKKAVDRGFPIPDDATITHGQRNDEEVWKFIGQHYDINMQGQTLMDKNRHPLHQLEDKIIKTPDGRIEYNPKEEFVKFFTLIGLASKREPVPEKLEAIQWLRKMYGDLHQQTKVDIGDTGNAFPIPDIVDAEILAFAREQSVILQYARVWPMTSEKQSFPAESAGASVYWGNTTQEGNPTITEVELDAEELSAYCTVRNTTLADSRSDVVGWIGETLSEASGLELDNKGFNGVGSDSPFICSGILSAACGYSVVFGSGSTAFSNVTGTNLSEMISKLAGLKKQGARYFMNGEILHFIRTLEDTSGRPVFFDGHYGTNTPPMLMSYPYTEVTNMPSTSAANTAFMGFGNLRYFGVGRRLDASALDIDPYGDWLTNRTRYKLYQRWALKMALANGFVRMLTAAS